MKHLSTNPDLPEMVQALRNEQAPEAPDALVRKAQGRRAAPRFRLGYMAVAGAAAFGIFAVTMTGTKADATVLDRMITATQDAPIMVSKIWALKSDGNQVLTHEYREAAGKKLQIFYEEGQEVLDDGQRLASYSKKDDALIIEKSHGVAHYRSSVKEYLNDEHVKSVVKVGLVRLDGLEKYKIESEFVDGGGYHQHFFTYLYGDPSTGRPVRLEIPRESVKKAGGGYFDGALVEWSFPSQIDGLNLSAPPSVPAFDMPKQRELVRRSLSGNLGVATVHGVRVELKSVVIDRQSNIHAITTGGGAGYAGNAPLKVNGVVIAEAGQTPIGDSDSERRLGLLGHVGKWGHDLGDSFKLSVPVWGKNRSLLGYADFSVKRPLRTLSIVSLLWPDNRSLFAEPVGDESGQATANTDHSG